MRCGLSSDGGGARIGSCCYPFFSAPALGALRTGKKMGQSRRLVSLTHARMKGITRPDVERLRLARLRARGGTHRLELQEVDRRQSSRHVEDPPDRIPDGCVDSRTSILISRSTSA